MAKCQMLAMSSHLHHSLMKVAVYSLKRLNYCEDTPTLCAVTGIATDLF